MRVELTARPWRTHPVTRPLAVVAGCLTLAVASLPIPATLGYDPWAWLVWGREAGRLELVTTGGPSWKPLPVVFTTVLSVFGDHAPTAWIVTSRALGLLALVAVGRLAARLAGPAAGALAGVLAAALLVLTPDTEARYLRMVLEGHSAPLTVAFLALAIDRHLAGRSTQALLLGAALALDRPEAWPFLGLYAVWSWWREPGTRWLVAAVAVLVPLLWFGGDWWGSGDPWHGADVAQVDARDTDRLPTALTRAFEVVILPAWVAAGVAVALALLRSRRRTSSSSDREDGSSPAEGPGRAVVLVMAAGALAWVALVVGMATVLGYAAIGRFYLPAAALVCVLAAVGVVRGVQAVPAGRWRSVAVAGVAVVIVALALPRVQELGPAHEQIAARHRLDRDADRVLAQVGGSDVVWACGAVATDDPSFPRMALAWKLDVSLDEVDWEPRSNPRVTMVRAGGRRDRALSGPGGEGVELARSVEWAVHAVDCPAAVARSR